jgi:tRNA (guanine37-N1)-methyltransferase
MGNADSPVNESFGPTGLLEEPHYTRPATYRGWDVPEVLRAGDHGRVARWRHAQALHRTLAARPDLIEARGGITDDERSLLEEFPPVPYP